MACILKVYISLQLSSFAIYVDNFKENILKHKNDLPVLLKKERTKTFVLSFLMLKLVQGLGSYFTRKLR
jgi:hypothetical protein